MTNLIIKSGQYPAVLKVTKVVPIRKEGKLDTSTEGWKPINIVLAISKVVEKTLLQQIITYLDRHNIIPQYNHGSVAKKSTQTLVADLHDSLIEDLNKDKETALIVLDQSKAYNLVDHPILLEKFRILGFNRISIQLLKEYLNEWRQYVKIQGFQSENLCVGPQSVTQGSTLSGALYLVYILDLPMIFHTEEHTADEVIKCKKQNLKTFVDDNFIEVKKIESMDIKQSIFTTMETVKTYMDANKLKLYSSKSKIMLISNRQEEKVNFEIQIEGKTLRHSPKLKFLGNILTDDLSWNTHVTDIVLPSIRNAV